MGTHQGNLLTADCPFPHCRCNEVFRPAKAVVNDLSDGGTTHNHPPAGTAARVLTIDKLYEKLPVFAKGWLPNKIYGTDNLPFTIDSDALPGVIRSYSSLEATVEETGMNRTYGGIHFLTSDLGGPAGF